MINTTFKKFLLLVCLLLQSDLIFSQQAIGTVYDSCTSPKRAQQTASPYNWVFGLSDRNSPSREGGSYSHDGCLAKIKNVLDDDSNILVSVDMYAFYSYYLADALVNLMNNGVNVIVQIDRGQAARQRQFAIDHDWTPIVDKLSNAGIIVFLRTGRAGGISHNKTITVVQQVSDGEGGVVYEYKHVTGSYNFSDNAESMNRENMVFIDSPILSIKTLNDAYTFATDIGDIETGARILLGMQLRELQDNSYTRSLPENLNNLFEEEGYAEEYMVPDEDTLIVDAKPETQPVMQTNITNLMGTSRNFSSTGQTDFVTIPGAPVQLGFVEDYRVCKVVY